MVIRYGVKSIIECKEVGQVMVLSKILESRFKKEGYQKDEYKITVDKKAKCLSILGVHPDRVSFAVDASKHGKINKIEYIPFNDLSDVQCSISSDNSAEEYRILKGRHNKLQKENSSLIGERSALECEVIELRKAVIADKGVYETQKNRIISGKDELKSELTGKIRSLESIIINTVENPIETFLTSMYFNARVLTQDCSSYNKHLNFIAISKRFEGKIDITNELIENLKLENNGTFEDTTYFIENCDVYKKAVEELKFLENYSSKKEFSVPEHLLKGVVDKIDKTENIKIKETIESAKELFDSLKSFDFEVEKADVNLNSIKLPYLVISSMNTEVYSVKVIAPVVAEDESNISGILKEHLLSSVSRIDGGVETTFEVPNEDKKLIGYSYSIDALSIHKSKFKAIVNDIVMKLGYLDSDSKLANGGFEVKVLPFNI